MAAGGGDSERERTETFSVKAGMDETRMFQYDVKPPLWVPSHLTPKVGSDITRMCQHLHEKWLRVGGTRKERGLKQPVQKQVMTVFSFFPPSVAALEPLKSSIAGSSCPAEKER